MKKLYTLLFLLIFCVINHANAQIVKIAEKVEANNKLLPVEKVYLSFDKPYYSVGDTVWFKSFLLNDNFTSSTRTDKIYVELFNDSLIKVDNRVIALNNGLGYGDFALSDKLKEGTYIIRAYSNWQQNFGSDYFFQKTFYIGNAGEKTWLLNSFQEINTTAASKTLDLKLRITNIKNEAIGLKDIEVYLMDGNKRLAKADLQTKLDGTLDTKIPLGNDKLSADYNIVIIDKKDKNRKSILPITLQKTDVVDLQFMPEGGHMVNDIFGKVAFKAIGFDGLGVDVTGKIVNNSNDSIAELKASHKGMGSFYLLPRKGESYTAIYNLNGKEQRIKLPLAKEEGTTLRIDQLSKTDSISIYIKASESKRIDGYQLLGVAAGENVLSAKLSLINGFNNLKLPKKDFTDGIVHFTLFSPENIALNERQVFINHHQKIDLQINTDKNSYQTKDSVALEITVTKEDGTPLSGTFAIAVTDDGQVKQKEYDENISSYFLLQSNLKGNIEEAGYYFKDQTASTLLALDHLLLTQGWIGYKWEEIEKGSPTPNFKAEKDNVIEGKLTNLFKAPVPNIKLTLMALGKTIFITDTTSNALGEFKFTDLPYLDSAAYSIKIKTAKGKTSIANIFVNEFTPAKSIDYAIKATPWYANADSTILNYYKNKQETKKPLSIEKLKLEGTLLNEVEIKGELRLKEFISKTAWDAKLFKTISEEDLKKTPRKTLLDLLKEKIPNFSIGRIYADGCFGPKEIVRPRRHDYDNFMIGQYLITHVMIDKVNTHLVATGIDDDYNANTNNVSKTALEPEVFFTNMHIFNTLNARDITEINIYRGCNNYFLDIRTRSGKGPWVITSPGVYVYRPLPIYLAKEFYSPKYTTNNNNLPDYRSTIFWDANVVTDENGKAKLSFYTADKASTYSIKIEGTDLNGRFGFKKSSITVGGK